MSLKTIAWIAGIAAVAAAGLAWTYHKRLGGMMPIPPKTPTLAEAKAAGQQNALAAAQVTKGSKAVAETAKATARGEVRTQDRNAEKAQIKGG